MQIDPRRDHSFRIPRPQLSVSTNAPNACTNCHADQDVEWAATAALNWWGESDAHFASAFAAARDGAGNVVLNTVISDRELPGIVRATALATMTSPASEADALSIGAGLKDPDPLVRMAAIGSAQLLAPETRMQLVAPALKDPSRVVQIEAARILAPMREYLPQNAGFTAAAEAFRDAQLAIANRPEAQVALGDFESSLGNPDQAITHYAIALEMDPTFSYSRLNYADALRRFGDEAAAEKLLSDGLAIDEDDADLSHALGLLLVRTGRSEEGLEKLRNAEKMAPDNPRYAYVVAIALNSLGQGEAALQALHKAHQNFAADFDIAWALATLLRDNGDIAAATNVAEELALRWPNDADIKALLESLRAAP